MRYDCVALFNAMTTFLSAVKISEVEAPLDGEPEVLGVDAIRSAHPVRSDT